MIKMYQSSNNKPANIKRLRIKYQKKTVEMDYKGISKTLYV